MAKIENTTAYPTVTPAMDDLLIATDVSNDNETVTFLVSDLIGGTGVLQGLQSVLDTGNTAIQSIDLTGDIIVSGTVAPLTITALGSTGLPGQLLSSTGAGLQWVNSPSTSCCSWNDSLISGATATTAATVDGVPFNVVNAGGGISISSPATLANSGTSTFTGQVNINSTLLNFNATGQINDGAGNTGTPGQWLTSTGTGLAWSSAIPPASCCDIQSTLGVGSVANNQGISFTGTSSVIFDTNVSISSAGGNVFSGNNTFSGSGTTLSTAGVVLSGTVWAGTSVGTPGQILSSTGTGVQWVNAGTVVGNQDLQSVLDTGNTATGANADITITGTINPGTITDSSGGTGAIGQVLSVSGSGLSWITPAAGTVTSVSLSAIQTSTGNALSISPTTGAVLVQPFVFGGTTNIGFVPEYTGGSPTTNFLRADGTWATATGGGAVTSVTAGAPGTSGGTPLTITPTTGAVVATSNAYAGTTNVGHVPAGGSATTFLRGDGTWQVPGGAASDTNSFNWTETAILAKFSGYVANEYMALEPFRNSGGIGVGLTNYNTSIGTSAPSAALSPIQRFSSAVFQLPADSCSTGKSKLQLCDITSNLIVETDSGLTTDAFAPGSVFTLECWRMAGDPCTSTDIFLAATCRITVTDSGDGTASLNCCSGGVLGSAADRTWEPGHSMMFTWRCQSSQTASPAYIFWRMNIRFEYIS